MIQLEKVTKQYLIRIVLVSEVSCKFSFVTFNMAPLLGLSFSFSDLISHQILTNIPSSMTFTIFLSIDLYLSLLLCCFVNKVIKLSSRYPHTRSTCIPPCRHVGCRYPFTLDYKLEGHNLFQLSLTHSYLSKVK